MKKEKKENFFGKFANKVTIATGSTAAILIAFALVVIWGATGPIFNYSETWQLVINTGTTIITFLMVFLIQKSQNKESLAVQLKLNELVAANELASNRLIDVEGLTEDELKVLHAFYTKLKTTAKKDNSLLKSHTIEEAEKVQGTENKEIKNSQSKKLKKLK